MTYWERYWDKQIENMLPPNSKEYFIVDPKKCDLCSFYKKNWPMAACIKSQCSNVCNELPTRSPTGKEGNNL